MKTYKVDKDEWWPVYYLLSEEDYGYRKNMPEAQFSDEEVARIKAAHIEMNEVNDLIFKRLRDLD